MRRNGEGNVSQTFLTETYKDLRKVFILNTGLSLCIRRLSCVSIYKSANDKIVQTGIKAELERKKRF